MGYLGEVMAHKYVIGATGSGKSSFMDQQALEDINAGFGVCFIDPHGYDIEEIKARIPKHRIKDTIEFDPTDPTHFICWNPLQETENIPFVSSVLTDTVKDTAGFHGSSTAQMEMFLEAVLTTFLKQGRTLAEVLDLLDNPEQLKGYDFNNPILTSFWKKYTNKSLKDKDTANNSTYNKFFRPLLDDRIRRIFSVKKGLFSVEKAVTNKILLVRLPQGQMGRSKVSLIGSLILSQIHLECLKRDPSIPYCIYIDEVHNFTHETISEMLSGLRKFNVHITVAHQFVKQLKPELFDSLMGNCAERHVFRVSPEDARRFQKDLGFTGDINLEDLNNFVYRTFPWHNIDLDNEVKPLGDIQRPSTPKRIRNNTHQFYCKKITRD